jgi:lipopolysaccharide export system protein LptA
VKTLLSIIMVLTLAAGLALAADVTGAWKASIPGRDGATMETTFNLKADGATLTGNVVTERGETAISDGKVTGDTISFKIKREFNGNAMVMVYEGSVSGNEIKFKTTREGSDRPPREFVAKKAQ